MKKNQKIEKQNLLKFMNMEKSLEKMISDYMKASSHLGISLHSSTIRINQIVDQIKKEISETKR